MIFLCLTFVASAILLDQTEIYYNPEIIMNPVTPMSFVFYVAYAVLLLFAHGIADRRGDPLQEEEIKSVNIIVKAEFTGGLHKM